MKRRVNNPILEKNLRALAVSVGPLYRQYMGDTSGGGRNFQNIVAFEAEVAKREGFGKCVAILAEDKAASPLFGSLVGVSYSQSLVETPDVCIMGFLYQFWSEEDAWSGDIFRDHYQKFEEFFYSSTLRTRNVTRLYRFNVLQGDFEIGHGVAIRRVHVDRDAMLREGRHFQSLRMSDFVIEGIHEQEKLVGRTNSASAGDALNQITDQFDDVIKALRVLKSSAVYRDNMISEEWLTFFPHGGRGSRSTIVGNEVVGGECVISEEEAAEVRTLFGRIHNESNPQFKIACSRLSSGMTRINVEDRRMYYMIGLEAMYLPDGSQELSIRLSMRVARMLEQRMSKQRNLFAFVRGMYNQRSNLLHGGSADTKRFPLNGGNVTRLEETLRATLKRWIDSNNLFSKGSLQKLDGP